MNEVWFEVVMRTLMSHFTAFLLVAHAVIGCCHHHWHSDAECCLRTTVAATCDCCASHGETTEPDNEPATPCNGGLECHGVCTYLPTPKTQVDDASDDRSIDLAAVMPRLFAAACVESAIAANRLSPPDSSPPLRLNLLQQRLVI
jgi:hypothetical protein